MKTHFTPKFRLLFIVSFLMVVFSACEKDKELEMEDDENYFIRMKVDGMARNFSDATKPPYALIYNDGNQFHGDFMASYTSNSSFIIQVLDTKAITERNFSGVTTTRLEGKDLFTGAILSLVSDSRLYSTRDIENPEISVKVSEINETFVRGEFSGKLKSQNGLTEVVITEGEFYVKREIPNL